MRPGGQRGLLAASDNASVGCCVSAVGPMGLKEAQVLESSCY